LRALEPPGSPAIPPSPCPPACTVRHGSTVSVRQRD